MSMGPMSKDELERLFPDGAVPSWVVDVVFNARTNRTVGQIRAAIRERARAEYGLYQAARAAYEARVAEERGTYEWGHLSEADKAAWARVAEAVIKAHSANSEACAAEGPEL